MQTILHCTQTFYRYPVKDDLIVSVDVKGKQPLPLPEALVALSLPEELMSDAIRVWDFLNTFRYKKPPLCYFVSLPVERNELKLKIC
jgi:hypothetical protein